MKRHGSMLPKIIFLTFSIALIFTGVTEADFIDKKFITNNKIAATTLDFNEIDTATNGPMAKLFDINGIVPGGFRVNSIRLKNEGQSNLYNKITSEIIDGDKDFCQSLEIELNYDDQSSFKGKLMDLSFETPALNPNTQSDWVVFIKFNKNDLNLQKKSCQFNLIFNGYNKTSNGLSGLKYIKKTNNNITSGEW
jgi:hypothetical protein